MSYNCSRHQAIRPRSEDKVKQDLVTGLIDAVHIFISYRLVAPFSVFEMLYFQSLLIRAYLCPHFSPFVYPHVPLAAAT